jgi:Ala-tRNA(Pro) deacylase
MPQTLKSFLDERRIPYEAMHHRRDYTSQHAAADTHTPGLAFAKTVILRVDEKFCMFVLPAARQIDMDKVKLALPASEVRLATEDEISGLCGDCEVGAMPPFGVLFDLPVYVSHRLTADRLITFNAGTHEDVVRMLYGDYAALVKPTVMNFTAGD